ncbi:amidase family protein [Tsukamurella soli]
MVTGAGNPDWAHGRAPASVDAASVALLRSAGATVVGKAHTDEFAYSLTGVNAHYGAADNPAAPGRVVGGSSSGPAAAVAAGLADVGLGTDTGGSIRVPASYCGLFGMRPTWGAVDATGVVPLAPSFDTVGVLCRDLPTLARATGVLVETPPRRDHADLPVVVAADLFALCVPTVASALLGAAQRGLGPRITGEIDVTRAVGGGAWVERFRTLQAAEFWRAHGRWITEVRPRLGPDVAGRVRIAAGIRVDDAAAAADSVGRARARLRDLVRSTVLVMPTAPGAAPAADDAERDRVATLRLTTVASIGGLPALSVPCIRTPDGPVGLCLVGPPGAEQALITLARHLVGWVATSPHPRVGRVAPTRRSR